MNSTKCMRTLGSIITLKQGKIPDYPVSENKKLKIGQSCMFLKYAISS